MSGSRSSPIMFNVFSLLCRIFVYCWTGNLLSILGNVALGVLSSLELYFGQFYILFAPFINNYCQNS